MLVVSADLPSRPPPLNPAKPWNFPGWYSVTTCRPPRPGGDANTRHRLMRRWLRLVVMRGRRVAVAACTVAMTEARNLKLKRYNCLQFLNQLHAIAHCVCVCDCEPCRRTGVIRLPRRQGATSASSLKPGAAHPSLRRRRHGFHPGTTLVMPCRPTIALLEGAGMCPGPWCTTTGI